MPGGSFAQRSGRVPSLCASIRLRSLGRHSAFVLFYLFTFASLFSSANLLLAEVSFTVQSLLCLSIANIVFLHTKGNTTAEQPLLCCSYCPLHRSPCVSPSLLPIRLHRPASRWQQDFQYYLDRRTRATPVSAYQVFRRDFTRTRCAARSKRLSSKLPGLTPFCMHKPWPHGVSTRRFSQRWTCTWAMTAEDYWAKSLKVCEWPTSKHLQRRYYSSLLYIMLMMFIV